VFERLRAVKTAEEIARMTVSAGIVERAYLAMWEALSEGITERQLAKVAMESMVSEEARWLSFMNCGAGVRSSREHFPPSDYAVRAGDLIRFDFGVCVEGYHADVGRTFALKPTSEQKEIYAAVFHAYEQTIAAMKPGVTGAEIYETYRREMGEYFNVMPLEWVGHSYGLELHESPFLAPLMNAPLEPGMVFAVEIVMDYPSREGYHVEDPILITEEGNRRLIELPNNSLEV
jgi:Xaa-Pro aminopeptidase